MLATAASKGRSLDSILEGSRRVTFNLRRSVAGLNTCISRHIACSGPSRRAGPGRFYSAEWQDVPQATVKPNALPPTAALPAGRRAAATRLFLTSPPDVPARAERQLRAVNDPQLLPACLGVFP